MVTGAGKVEQEIYLNSFLSLKKIITVGIMAANVNLQKDNCNTITTEDINVCRTK